jgi:peptidoglycan/LPS O-acetylase OafA/YrhL
MRTEMSAGFSRYLDALRLAAALVVLFSHLGHGHLVGGFLWPFTRWGGEAVMAFFVLSGFVIAHVVDTRQDSWVDFAAARVARLFSVIVPAMVLTLALDAAGRSFNAATYAAVGQWQAEESALLNYLLSLVMLNQSWGLNRHFGSNGAYWSIPFEFWYYAIFGAFCLMRGWARWGAIAAAALLAGPRILALFPVWLLGVAAYRLRGQSSLLRTPVIGCVFTLVALMLMLLLDVKRPEALAAAGLRPDTWPWQCLFGLLVAAHLVFASALRSTPQRWCPPLLARGITFAAGVSLSLYLFHLPILNFLHALRPMFPNQQAYILALLVLPLLVSATLGKWCEAQKAPLRRLLLRLRRAPT